MDSPNKITNRNTGTQVVTGIRSGNPNSPRSQPSWVTSTSTPYEALIDSRFMTAALSATVTDRNTTVSKIMDTATTIATSNGSRRPITLVKATLAALGPVR